MEGNRRSGLKWICDLNADLDQIIQTEMQTARNWVTFTSLPSERYLLAALDRAPEPLLSYDEPDPEEERRERIMKAIRNSG